MVTLQLEDNALGILAALVYNHLGDSAQLRFDTSKVIYSTFEEVFGVTPSEAFENVNLCSGHVTWAGDVEKVLRSLKSDAPRVTFEYHGSQRVVENPEFKGHLLGGVEVRKDGVYTEQYKNYLLSEITF